MLLDEQKLNRKDIIGGSDVPIIMGVSKFKTPWDLLLIKSGIKEDHFGGNLYSEMGNILEPRIQKGLNIINVDEITYEKTYFGVHFACHIDGLNQDKDEIQEIKVANQSIIQCYKSYEWQIRTYMYVVGLNKAQLILLPRARELKNIIQKIIKKYNFSNLHNFEELDKCDVDNACEDLKKSLIDVKLYKKMFEIKSISYDSQKETEFLKKTKLFWEYRNKLVTNHTLATNFEFMEEFKGLFPSLNK